MPKKITYYVQRYRPEYEAISKEAELLATHFARKNEVTIFNLHLDGLASFTFQSQRVSHHFAWYPFTVPYAYALSTKSDLNHIYTSLGDLPYLPVLNLQKTILTAAASCRFEKMSKRKRYLQQLVKVLVESEKQKRELLGLGLKEECIGVIYPPVDLAAFTPVPATGAFTILYASCPTRENDFQKRGIFLLREALAKLPEVNLVLTWRTGAEKEIAGIITEHNKTTPTIQLKKGIITDMNREYAAVHCTIIPYTEFDDYLKLIPNSALESLAAGKPLLVSRKTEIASLVEKENCGLAFEPTVEDLLRAIQQLRRTYSFYQQHCRKTAEKYFSQDRFLRSYEKIYQKFGVQ